MIFITLIFISSINTHQVYAQNNNIRLTARYSRVYDCILFLYILVKYINDSKILKFNSEVSLDINSIYFDNVNGNTYLYGTVYYNDWSLCRSEYKNYRLLCLISKNELTVSDFKSFGNTTGLAITCNGNVLDKGHYNFSYPNYWGCAIMGNNNNNFYVGVYKEVSFNHHVLDISRLSIYASSSNGVLYGTVIYKQWNNCASISADMQLKCVISTYFISKDSFISSTGIRYTVSCYGNQVIYHFDEPKSGYEYYYACGLINYYNVIYDYDSSIISDITYIFDISHLNVESALYYFKVSGTVYYPMFSKCYGGLFRLVFRLTETNPNYNSFLSIDRIFDVNCSGSYVDFDYYNYKEDKVLSCGIVDKARSFTLVYETLTYLLGTKIDLKEVKMKNNRTESIAHITGTVKYDYWRYCFSENSKYRLRCYGSYDKINKSDIIKGEAEIINCNGNNIDSYIKGKGKSVYFGCGIVSSNGITLNTYKVKEFKIKHNIGLVFKMFGLCLAFDVILPFLIFILVCLCRKG